MMPSAVVELKEFKSCFVNRLKNSLNQTNGLYYDLKNVDIECINKLTLKQTNLLYKHFYLIEMVMLLIH